MNVNGAVTINTQSASALQNSSPRKEQATDLQKQTMCVAEKIVQPPVGAAQGVSNEIVNARVAEYQSRASGNQATADEAVGSLMDIRV